MSGPRPPGRAKREPTRCRPARYAPRCWQPPTPLWILFFLAGPLFLLAQVSLYSYVPGQGIIETLQFGNYARALTDSLFLRVIGNTLLLGGWTTLSCAVLGFPLAIMLVRTTGLARAALYFAIVIPLLTSAVTKTFSAGRFLLSNRGIVNQAMTELGLVDRPIKLMYTMTGAVIALTQVLLPFMTLALAAALETIDQAIYEAARNLGARSTRLFLFVTLPLSLPGLVSGSVLVFTLAVSAYVTPRLVGGPTVKVVLGDDLRAVHDAAQPAARLSAVIPPASSSAAPIRRDPAARARPVFTMSAS